LGVFAHAVRGAVEDGDFAGGGEDFEVEDVGYCSGEADAQEDEAEVEGLLGCAGGFFAEGEGFPGDLAGVVDDGYAAAAGCGRGFGQGGCGCWACLPDAEGGRFVCSSEDGSSRAAW